MMGEMEANGGFLGHGSKLAPSSIHPLRSESHGELGVSLERQFLG